MHVSGVFLRTCAGRGQLRRGRFRGCCLVSAGTEQLHVVGRKPPDLTLLPPGLNQSQQEKKNCQYLIEYYLKHMQLDIYIHLFLMLTSEMAEFQIFDIIFRKINPASQIIADDNCVPHTGQNSSDSSSVFPGGGSH